MEYKGMTEDERLVSVTPSQRQIVYQNRGCMESEEDYER